MGPNSVGGNAGYRLACMGRPQSMYVLEIKMNEKLFEERKVYKAPVTDQSMTTSYGAETRLVLTANII
jgi:hypothetical protein